MVSFAVGVTLTAIAWIGVLGFVVHGKYVTEKIAAGEYDKGPFRDRGGDADE